MSSTALSIIESSKTDSEHAFTGWLNEFRGLPWQETEMEKLARLAAAEYRELTDKYDDIVCTGTDARGMKWPANGQEHSLITHHARDAMNHVCSKHDVSSKMVYEALQRIRRQ